MARLAASTVTGCRRQWRQKPASPRGQARLIGLALALPTLPLVILQQLPGPGCLPVVMGPEAAHADTPAAGRGFVVTDAMGLKQGPDFVRFVVGHMAQVHQVVGHGIGWLVTVRGLPLC